MSTMTSGIRRRRGHQIISSVDPDLPGYSDVVEAVSGLLAYWRFSHPTLIVDETAGNRDGTYTGAISIVGGLPPGSDNATHFSGFVSGIVPHDSGLSLGSLSLSMWVRINVIPQDPTAIISKNKDGFGAGEFFITIDDDATLYVTFQSASAEFNSDVVPVGPSGVYHIVVAAGTFGFQLWINGKHIGTETGWTGGWTGNAEPIRFAANPSSSITPNIVLDEVALYNRAITEAEIIDLSLKTSPPVAGDVSGLTVTESGGVTIIHVEEFCEFVGRKSSLTVNLGGQEDFGNAVVNGSNDIVYTAGAVPSNQVDSFTYTITDVNGTSNFGNISVTVLNTASSPVAGNISGITVGEGDVETIDVEPFCQFVGNKSSLTVNLGGQEDFGTAIVNASKNIIYTAGSVSANQSDSFTYSITDVNGTSNAATISLTVVNAASPPPPPPPGGSGDGRGGTLIYNFTPRATWIDGVSLANRHYDQNPGGVADINRWRAGDSFGGSHLLSIDPDVNTGNGDVCWNRAPAASSGSNAGVSIPALEARCRDGTSGGANVLGFYIRLFQAFQGTPKHCRVVVELKTCKTSDPNTHKSRGVGTTSGGYPNFNNTRITSSGSKIAGKYPCGMFMGNYSGAHGGCRANWWQGAPCDAPESSNPSYCGPESNFVFNSDRGSNRWNFGGSGSFGCYSYCYGRPGRCGNINLGSPSIGIESSGVLGVWHKIEAEVKLSSEASCPSNAKYNNPPISPSQTGDGFAKHFITKDIDGELGTPGTRTLNTQSLNLLWFCREDNVKSGRDNLHKDSPPGANINGPWLNWYYGGGVGSQAEGWLWIRRIQFYEY